jgi:hypothetical protein
MAKKMCLIAGMIILSWVSSPFAKEFQFPQIAGWKQSGEMQTYEPDNLFDYIDGAADLYLNYGFRELKVAEYQNEKKASVIVEVYRHKTPVQAFGIYSQERRPDGDFLDIGAQGYSEKDVLNFFAGDYYVKMNSYKTGPEDQEILLLFAKKVLENLEEKGSLPLTLSAFPQDGKKKNSEKFIARNFLGYSFLHSAFTADYELSGKKFKLFIIEGADPDECHAMLQKYLEQTTKLGKNASEGRRTISDPHHGEIDLLWKGKWLWGILSLEDVALRTKYLKLLEEGIEKRK